MLRPSCPVLVVHDDDPFRKKLIAELDQNHFTVTISTDGDAALEILGSRKFSVVLLGVNLATKNGLRSLDYLRNARESAGCGVILLGEPDPRLRVYAPWADETLLKPVDTMYVVTRAMTYCQCS